MGKEISSFPNLYPLISPEISKKINIPESDLNQPKLWDLIGRTSHAIKKELTDLEISFKEKVNLCQNLVQNSAIEVDRLIAQPLPDTTAINEAIKTREDHLILLNDAITSYHKCDAEIRRWVQLKKDAYQKNCKNLDPAVPKKILRKLNLSNGVSLLKDIPLTDLPGSLAGLKDKTGKFYLTLQGRTPSGDIKGHSIYLTFQPPRFCDNNDLNKVTGIPKEKKFSSQELMIAGLNHLLAFEYSTDGYTKFDLVRHTDLI